MTKNWALRAHEACDWVLWAAAMNALWLGGTIAGGVVLGLAPATVAVSVLTRRRLRGERFAVVAAFATAWRREFLGAQIAVGVPVLIAALLIAQGTAQLGRTGGPWAAALLVGGAYAAVVAAVSSAMVANYELRGRSYVPAASRWLLRNLPHALLLLAVGAVLTAATLALPSLAVFLSVGAWLTASTVISLGFFAVNEAAIAQQNEGVHP
ncbi:DUF624 domain-containing protein [Arenivirga flava]|uniref:DUF624 domain-containing protein n=1 Tax=Arenivirga flava TaxID=1930060 RepID=A0AA37UFB4_9MICO|nr:DUF624 domain-containing protein [Arenivirga flava]GMA27874.1 hypothetical protein GCM10025874_11270 [Arenivirga flava]